MLFASILVAAGIAACSAGPVPQGDFGWNQLLQADDLFDAPKNAIQSKSFDTDVIVDELSTLLGSGSVLSELYTKFVGQYSKQAESQRMETFKTNLLKFAANNAELMAKGKGPTMGVNQFADMTYAEFASIYLVQLPRDNATQTPTVFKKAPKAGSKDWRAEGMVSSVKNQGSCGSCAIFSAVAAVESAQAITTGNAPQDLSEQEIVDCGDFVDATICSKGGPGTWPKDSVQFIADNGIATLADYPYIGTKQGKQQCRKDSVDSQQIAASYGILDSGDEAGLQDAVANGPTGVIIYVPREIMSYKGSATINPANCKSDGSHAITAVGYTEDKWIIKNSWGTGWGDKGYLNLAKKNKCWAGVSTTVTITE